MKASSDTSWRRLDVWLRRYKSPHTRRAYFFDLQNFREAMGTLPELAEVEAASAYVQTLRPSAARRMVAALRAYLHYGERARWWEPSPLHVLEVERQRPLPPIVPETDEILEAIQAEPTLRNRLLAVLLYIGGLRVSEARTLTRDSLDGEFLRIDGKGSKMRAIRLPKALVAEISQGHGPLLVGRQGPLSDTRAREVIREMGARVGMRLHPHILRHAHATHALDAGCSLKVLQETLGHSSLATTSIYLHARPAESSARYLPSAIVDALGGAPGPPVEGPFRPLLGPAE